MIVNTTVSRIINKRLILETLLENKTISRADLARLTGLNKATVSYITKELEDDGIIVLGNERISTGSRQSLSLEFNDTYHNFIILEINHKYIKATHCNIKGSLDAIKKYPLTSKDFSYAFNLITKIIDEYILLNNLSNQKYSIGISVPATITNENNIKFAPYFNWHQIPIHDMLVKLYNTKIYIQNEANLSAIAEYYAYNEETSNLISINVGSGVGLGMILNKELQLGYNGFFGEFGHMTLFPGGLQCSCGNKGCFELYTSEYYILKEYRKIKQDDNLLIEDFINSIKSDLQANLIYNNFIDYFAIGLHNLIVLNNPEIIILNSKVIKTYPDALGDLINQLNTREVNYNKILVSNLSNNASIEGLKILMIKDTLQLDIIK